MKNILRFCVSAILICSLAQAVQMNYTFTSSGSGTLDGTSFETTDVSMTFDVDNDNLTIISDVYIGIYGLGNYSLSSSLFYVNFVNDFSYANRVEIVNSDNESLFNIQFSPAEYPVWDNETEITYYGNGTIQNWNSDTEEIYGFLVSDGTNLHDLYFNDSENFGTFTASATPQPIIPEPATMALLGLGGLALRRKRNA